VHGLDPEQFVPVITPLPQLLGRTLAQAQFNTLLLGAFATIAILLAAIGIYGVIAYNVTQRTKEIGIRMALGAQQSQMLRMILHQSLTMAMVGIGVGVFCAFGATRLLSSLLFGVGPTDVVTYAAVIALLAAAAILAAFVPARRAMKINPVIALRYE
jgi:putative ABC transport system permease protein